MIELRALPWLKILSYLAALLAGCYFTSLYYTAQIEGMKAMQAKEQSRIAEASRIAHEQAVQKQNENEVKRDKEKRDAKRETDNLRTKYLNELVSLRVKGVSTASPDSSSIAAGTCALDSDAGEGYFALRYAINELESDYDLCIDTLKSDRGIK